MVGIYPDDDRSSVRIKTAWTPGPNPPKMEPHPARVSNSQLQKLANNDDRTSVSIKTAWNPGPNPPKMHPHPAGEGRANAAYTDSIWRQAWRLFCVCCGAQESHTTEERQVYGNFSTPPLRIHRENISTVGIPRYGSHSKDMIPPKRSRQKFPKLNPARLARHGLGVKMQNGRDDNEDNFIDIGKFGAEQKSVKNSAVRTMPRPKPHQKMSIDIAASNDDFFDPGQMRPAEGKKDQKLIRFRQEESDDEQFCDVNILLGQKNVDHDSLKLKAHFSDNEAGFIRTPPRPKPRQRTSIDYNVDSDDFFDPGNLHPADGSKKKRLIRFGQKDQLKLKAHFSDNDGDFFDPALGGRTNNKQRMIRIQQARNGSDDGEFCDSDLLLGRNNVDLRQTLEVTSDVNMAPNAKIGSRPRVNVTTRYSHDDDDFFNPDMGSRAGTEKKTDRFTHANVDSDGDQFCDVDILQADSRGKTKSLEVKPAALSTEKMGLRLQQQTPNRIPPPTGMPTGRHTSQLAFDQISPTTLSPHRMTPNEPRHLGVKLSHHAPAMVPQPHGMGPMSRGSLHMRMQQITPAEVPPPQSRVLNQNAQLNMSLHQQSLPTIPGPSNQSVGGAQHMQLNMRQVTPIPVPRPRGETLPPAARMNMTLEQRRLASIPQPMETRLATSENLNLHLSHLQLILVLRR